MDTSLSKSRFSFRSIRLIRLIRPIRPFCPFLPLKCHIDLRSDARKSIGKTIDQVINFGQDEPSTFVEMGSRTGGGNRTVDTADCDDGQQLKFSDLGDVFATEEPTEEKVD